MKTFRVWRSATANYAEYANIQAENEKHAMTLIADDPDQFDWKQGEDEMTSEWNYSLDDTDTYEPE
jgi:hypothetical protein